MILTLKNRRLESGGWRVTATGEIWWAYAAGGYWYLGRRGAFSHGRSHPINATGLAKLPEDFRFGVWVRAWKNARPHNIFTGEYRDDL